MAYVYQSPTPTNEALVSLNPPPLPRKNPCARVDANLMPTTSSRPGLSFPSLDRLGNSAYENEEQTSLLPSLAPSLAPRRHSAGPSGSGLGLPFLGNIEDCSNRAGLFLPALAIRRTSCVGFSSSLLTEKEQGHQTSWKSKKRDASSFSLTPSLRRRIKRKTSVHALCA
ncbi:unnamed protein product [Cylindrotheca closterium]|uniref:Uncharacterized protein n=1 Tax=Cylindrotheca closterium TaxID=2856 RepID=A0AAD2G8N3_9STRA|nr:unnamed protein product [Cylindrotheca closterium]